MPKAIINVENVTPVTMAEVVSRLTAALVKVVSHKGAPGPDGQTVERLREQWPFAGPRLAVGLLDGSYRPGAIRRANIPKAGGGVRGLGIQRDRYIGRSDSLARRGVCATRATTPEAKAERYQHGGHLPHRQPRLGYHHPMRSSPTTRIAAAACLGMLLVGAALIPITSLRVEDLGPIIVYGVALMSIFLLLFAPIESVR